SRARGPERSGIAPLPRPRRREMPTPTCWETSRARRAPCLPPASSGRVALGVALAGANITKEREHGTRPHEVREPAQLPRIAHRGHGGPDSVPDAGARD